MFQHMRCDCYCYVCYDKWKYVERLTKGKVDHMINSRVNDDTSWEINQSIRKRQRTGLIYKSFQVYFYFLASYFQLQRKVKYFFWVFLFTFSPHKRELVALLSLSFLILLFLRKGKVVSRLKGNVFNSGSVTPDTALRG